MKTLIAALVASMLLGCGGPLPGEAPLPASGNSRSVPAVSPLVDLRDAFVGTWTGTSNFQIVGSPQVDTRPLTRVITKTPYSDREITIHSACELSAMVRDSTHLDVNAVTCPPGIMGGCTISETITFGVSTLSGGTLTENIASNFLEVCPGYAPLSLLGAELNTLTKSTSL